MVMNKVDCMKKSQASISLNEVLSLWGAQVKKVQKLLEMNESFPDGNAYSTLLAEFRVLEQLGSCFANANFLLDNDLINAVNKTHVK